MTRRNENGITMNRAFAKLLSDGSEVERLRAELDALKAELEVQAHRANEWADAATNGLQWARNIKDGYSSPEQAEAALLLDIAHCREVGQAGSGDLRAELSAYIAREKRLREAIKNALLWLDPMRHLASPASWTDAPVDTAMKILEDALLKERP